MNNPVTKIQIDSITSIEACPLEDILKMSGKEVKKRFKYLLDADELKKAGLMVRDGSYGSYLYSPEFWEVLKEINNEHYKDKDLQTYQNKVNTWLDEKFRAGELPVQLVYSMIPSGKNNFLQGYYADTYQWLIPGMVINKIERKGVTFERGVNTRKLTTKEEKLVNKLVSFKERIKMGVEAVGLSDFERLTKYCNIWNSRFEELEDNEEIDFPVYVFVDDTTHGYVVHYETALENS